MRSATEQAESLTDEDLLDLATRTVLAVLKSADPEVIGRMNWWDRAKTALETAANSAESWSHMVSRMGGKLQITSPLAATAKEISSIGRHLKDEQIFERFRSLCQRDALYIVAIARMQREEAKQK